MANQKRHQRMQTTSLSRLAARLLAFLAVLALATPAWSISAADAERKLSGDLHQALGAASVAGIPWANETATGRMVQVVVLADATADPSLSKLRRAITDA